MEATHATDKQSNKTAKPGTDRDAKPRENLLKHEAEVIDNKQNVENKQTQPNKPTQKNSGKTNQ